MSEPAQAISHAESTPDGTTESLPEAEVDDLQREIQGSSSRPRTIKTTIGALALGRGAVAKSCFG